MEASKKQQLNCCPVCGGLHIFDYHGTLNDGNQIGYRWTCARCKATGVEWYQLTFIEHTVDEKKP